MKTIKIISACLFLTVAVMAKPMKKGEQFKGKFFYVVAKNNAVSKCFQLGKNNLKAIQKYDQCSKSAAQGMSNSIGQCHQRNGMRAFFFDTKTTCEGARTDAQARTNN